MITKIGSFFKRWYSWSLFWDHTAAQTKCYSIFQLHILSYYLIVVRQYFAIMIILADQNHAIGLLQYCNVCDILKYCPTLKQTLYVSGTRVAIVQLQYTCFNVSPCSLPWPVEHPTYPQRSTSEPLLYILNQDCNRVMNIFTRRYTCYKKESKILHMQLDKLLLRCIR